MQTRCGLHRAIAESVRRLVGPQHERLGASDRAHIADLARAADADDLDAAALERLDSVLDLGNTVDGQCHGDLTRDG